MGGPMTGKRLTRYLAATIVALLVAFAYVITCFHYLGELDHKGQAALVGVSAFSFVTSGILLYDVSQSTNEELGKLSHERASLIIGLILVCIYVPLSVGGTFVDAANSRPAAALPGAVPASSAANSG